MDLVILLVVHGSHKGIPGSRGCLLLVVLDPALQHQRDHVSREARDHLSVGRVCLGGETDRVATQVPVDSVRQLVGLTTDGDPHLAIGLHQDLMVRLEVLCLLRVAATIAVATVAGTTLPPNASQQLGVGVLIQDRVAVVATGASRLVELHVREDRKGLGELLRLQLVLDGSRQNQVVSRQEVGATVVDLSPDGMRDLLPQRPLLLELNPARTAGKSQIAVTEGLVGNLRHHDSHG